MKMNTAIVTAAIELRNQVMTDVVSQLVGEVRVAVRAPARFKFTVGTVEYAVQSAQIYTELLVKSRTAYAKTFNVLGVQPNEVGTFTAGAKTYVVEWSPTNKAKSWAVANAVTLVETSAVVKVPKEQKAPTEPATVKTVKQPRVPKAPTEPKQPTTPKQPRVPKDKTPKDKTATKPDPQVLG